MLYHLTQTDSTGVRTHRNCTRSTQTAYDIMPITARCNLQLVVVSLHSAHSRLYVILQTHVQIALSLSLDIMRHANLV